MNMYVHIYRGMNICTHMCIACACMCVCIYVCMYVCMYTHDIFLQWQLGQDGPGDFAQRLRREEDTWRLGLYFCSHL